MEEQLKKDIEKNEHRIMISLDDLKHNSESLEWELELKNLEESFSGAGRARCVFVATKTTLSAPEGRRFKKKSFKAKIEEITELLVNEISSFEKSVERLERVSDKLHSVKVGIDIEEYKSLVVNHQKQMRAVLDSQERMYNRYENLLKNAKIYPNWAVVVFVISIILCFGSLFYAIIML